MAVRVKYADLTEEHKKYIRDLLIQKPEEDYITARARNMYKMNYGGMPPEKEEIKIYEVSEGELWLPFTFAKILLGKSMPKRSFPKIDLQFLGELRENQVSVIDEAKKQLDTYQTTTLWLHPGFGKTILGARLASHLKIKTIVVHTMVALNIQWYTAFNTQTNGSIWVVGETKNPPKDPDIVICKDTRLSKLSDDFIAKYGLLIIDEAHQWCSTQIRVSKLMRFQPSHIIIESATIEKEDKMEKVVRHIAGLHHIRRDYQKEFQMLRIMTKIEPPINKTIHGTNMDALRKDLARNTKRHRLVCELVAKHKQYKILILSWLVEHCDKMFDDLVEQEGKENVSRFYGNRKKYDDARVIVGTFNKVGTGFDEALACHDWKGERINLVIMTMLVKNVNFYEQVVGRGLRADYPSFICLVDENATIKRHWGANKTWLTNHQCKIKTLTWDGETTPCL
jgi:superfamily II DNA or RNA helicase